MGLQYGVGCPGSIYTGKIFPHTTKCFLEGTSHNKPHKCASFPANAFELYPYVYPQIRREICLCDVKRHSNVARPSKHEDSFGEFHTGV